MSSEDEHPPKKLLQPVSHFELPNYNLRSPPVMNQAPSTTKKPYQITFATRDDEIQYIQRLMENCTAYNGDPAQLTTWLRETGAFIAKEGYPETNHPFIIRHLLIDDALDYYLAHEDIIFNFYDLRKLFLHKQKCISSLTYPSVARFHYDTYSKFHTICSYVYPTSWRYSYYR